MKRKIITASLAAVSIFIGSCGLSDENTPEACKFAVSQALDRGNYDEVIQKLESDPTCGGAYNNEEGNIQLAAAYIGKAGFDIPSLINDVIEAGTNKNADSYSLFIQAIAKRAKGKTLDYLNKARKYYEDIYGSIDCKNLQSLTDISDIVKDACFYAGLTDTAKATTSVTLLIGGDATDTEEISNLVDKWANTVQSGGTTSFTCDSTDINANGIPDSADASACALKYSVSLSDNDTTNDGIPYDCGNGITITNTETNITFTKPSTTFTSLTITVNKDATKCSDTTIDNSKTFKRLIYDIGGGIYTTAITDGYCAIDRTTCSDPTANGCYPCPVITEKEENGQTTEVPASTVDAIIDTINNGIDSIVAVVPQDNTGEQSTIEEKVTEFKKDLCSYEPSACLCDTNGDGVIDSNDGSCTSNSINNTSDIKIKSPTDDPNVQQLISDYLQNAK